MSIYTNIFMRIYIHIYSYIYTYMYLCFTLWKMPSALTVTGKPKIHFSKYPLYSPWCIATLVPSILSLTDSRSRALIIWRAVADPIRGRCIAVASQDQPHP